VTIAKACGWIILLSFIAVIVAGVAKIADFHYTPLTSVTWVVGWIVFTTTIIIWIVSSALKDLKDNRARDYWD